jgi:hypothetical protein
MATVTTTVQIKPGLIDPLVVPTLIAGWVPVAPDRALLHGPRAVAKAFPTFMYPPGAIHFAPVAAQA